MPHSVACKTSCLLSVLVLFRPACLNLLTCGCWAGARVHALACVLRHHDPDSVKALMAVCKDLMAARSAFDFEKEQRIYETHLASGKHVWDIAKAMKQGATPMADAIADATDSCQSTPYCTQTRGRNFLHVLLRPSPRPVTSDATESCEPEPEPGYGIGESIEVGQAGAIQ